MKGEVDLDTDSGGFSQGPPVSAPAQVLVAELRYDSAVCLGPRGFAGDSARAHGLNTILQRSSAGRPVSRLPVTAQEQAQRGKQSLADLAQLPESRRGPYAHAGFLQVSFKSPRDAQRAVTAFAADPAVWRVGLAPVVVPAGATRPASVVTGRARGSRNYEPTQGYLHAAPTGIDAGAAWRLPGGRGFGVGLVDVEGNWRRGHEDLPRGIRLLGGRPVPDDHWRDHGTAVLGELVARPGRAGLQGICSDAQVHTHSAFYAGGVNAARAVLSAAEHLSPGDFLLLEVQALGPEGRYVSVLHFDDVYSAVLSVLHRGIGVIAAAGNGGVDFDAPPYEASNLSKPNSAILVGAAIPPTNSYDVDGSYARIGAPRSPMPFTNSGRQVALHGWGWHVATLGFGDAQGGASDRWITLRFAGTSSAAPMVAGAAACLQGIASQRGVGPLPPHEMRNLLISTATDQAPGRHIGGQPDLRRALAALDLLGS